MVNGAALLPLVLRDAEEQELPGSEVAWSPFWRGLHLRHLFADEKSQ